MSTLLALDTATEACSVALLHDGKVTSHYEVIPRLHAQKLLPMIKQLLEDAGTTLAAVDAIAFGRGPGAFTGVRITIGVVQGLAFALERPVLPVSNLAVLAQRALREHGASQVAAAIDARMDEVYWGCYRETAGEMRLVGAEAVLAPKLRSCPLTPAVIGSVPARAGVMASASRCRVPSRTQRCCPTPKTCWRWHVSHSSAARRLRRTRQHRCTCAIKSRRPRPNAGLFDVKNVGVTRQISPIVRICLGF